MVLTRQHTQPFASPGRNPGSASARSRKFDTWSQQGDALLAFWLLLVMVAARLGVAAGEAPATLPACVIQGVFVTPLTALQQGHV
jgi:hypothetical protein